MKRSTNLAHSAAGDHRNRYKHLVEAMRMVGMTDAEIRAELEKIVAARTPPLLAATPANETCPGQSEDATAGSGQPG